MFGMGRAVCCVGEKRGSSETHKMNARVVFRVGKERAPPLPARALSPSSTGEERSRALLLAEGRKRRAQTRGQAREGAGGEAQLLFAPRGVPRARLAGLGAECRAVRGRHGRRGGVPGGQQPNRKIEAAKNVGANSEKKTASHAKGRHVFCARSAGRQASPLHWKHTALPPLHTSV